MLQQAFREPNAVFWVVQSFQNRRNIDWWRSPKWTTFHVNRRRSHRCSSWFDSPKSPFDYQRDCWRCRHQLWIMPSNSDWKTQHAPCCCKIALPQNSCPVCWPRTRKHTILTISQELLDHVSVDENFLKIIVTGDETWVYGYDIKTKAQSSQWVGQGLPRLKKAQMSWSNMKVMLVVFFDWQGVIHYKFVPHGQTVNKEFYVAVLKRLREAVRRKRP